MAFFVFAELFLHNPLPTEKISYVSMGRNLNAAEYNIEALVNNALYLGLDEDYHCMCTAVRSLGINYNTLY